jgi:hypothetical protein
MDSGVGERTLATQQTEDSDTDTERAEEAAEATGCRLQDHERERHIAWRFGLHVRLRGRRVYREPTASEFDAFEREERRILRGINAVQLGHVQRHLARARAHASGPGVPPSGELSLRDHHRHTLGSANLTGSTACPTSAASQCCSCLKTHTLACKLPGISHRHHRAARALVILVQHLRTPEGDLFTRNEARFVVRQTGRQARGEYGGWAYFDRGAGAGVRRPTLEESTWD